MNLPVGLKSKILKNELSCKHTTFKIGGRVPLWIEPVDLDELLKILSLFKREKRRYFIIGSGSNLLIRGKGIKEVFIRLSSTYFKSLKMRKGNIVSGCGVSLNSIINFSAKNSLSGLEGLCGIPASLGGAIYMNASSNGVAISDYVKEVKIIERNLSIKTLQKKDISFAHRQSSLKKAIIIEAALNLDKCSKDKVLKRKEYYLIKKRKDQPLASKSAGCIFKNPDNSKYSSAKLIEMAGLKGASIGGAKVSSKHANYIVNYNQATAEEVKLLIKKIRGVVKKKYNIILKREIIYI